MPSYGTEMTSEPEEKVEKLSPEDQELLDQALKNLVGFIEEETNLGMWELEETPTSEN